MVTEKEKQHIKEYRNRHQVKEKMNKWKRDYQRRRYHKDPKYREYVLNRVHKYRKSRTGLLISGKKGFVSDTRAKENLESLLEKSTQYFGDEYLAELFVLDGVPLQKEMEKRNIIFKEAKK